jgi:hypothetical protein
MAKKISDLAAAAAIKGDELLELVQSGTNVKVLAGGLLTPGYIDGLKMVYVSGNALTARSGAAFIPGLGRVLFSPADITLTGVALSASTWYHAYLYLNGAVPALELVTTAPAAPYSGTARVKTGDTSRRYIGSAKTNAAAAIIKFFHYARTGTVKYLQDINTAPLSLLAGGSALTDTPVSAAAVVPVTSTIMYGFAENGSTAAVAYLSNPDVGAPANTNILEFLRAKAVCYGEFALSSDQRFSYMLNGADTGLTVWCNGYVYER